MAHPTAADVAAYLGQDNLSEGAAAKLTATIDVVTPMVRAYVRGNGFDQIGAPSDDLAAVIITSTARLASNPDLTKQQTAGPFAVSYGTFQGWTLPELAILNSYRRRAM